MIAFCSFNYGAVYFHIFQYFPKLSPLLRIIHINKDYIRSEYSHYAVITIGNITYLVKCLQFLFLPIGFHLGKFLIISVFVFSHKGFYPLIGPLFFFVIKLLHVSPYKTPVTFLKLHFSSLCFLEICNITEMTYISCIIR